MWNKTRKPGFERWELFILGRFFLEDFLQAPAQPGLYYFPVKSSHLSAIDRVLNAFQMFSRPVYKILIIELLCSSLIIAIAFLIFLLLSSPAQLPHQH